MDLTYIVFPLLIIFLTIFWFKRRRLPPGPWNLPIVGYLPWIDPRAPHLTLTKLSRKYGPVYGLYLGNVYTVIISDVKIVRNTLKNEKATGRPPLFVTNGIMNGHGIICAEGDLWKDQRKFIYNCLRSFGALKMGVNRKKLKKIIIENILELVTFIQNTDNDPILIDPLEPLRHCIGNIMNILVFGECWARDDKTWKWLQELQEEGTKHIGVAGPLNFLPFLRFLTTYQKTLQFLLDGIEKTHNFYQILIDKQKNIFDIEKHEPVNFIQAFLLERERRKNSESNFYCDKQFYHLLADIFGAGLDTTLTTLRWLLLYLAVYKNVQSKFRQQLIEILNDNLPSMDDLINLPYVEATICEVQRIRSVVPVGIPHSTLNEMTIDNYKVPKNSMILPLQWAIHMDPDNWNNPDEFLPERFINDDGKFFKPDSFIPFQTGKRMCVGDEFAKMMLFLTSSIIIKNFEINCEPGTGIDLDGDSGITLTPKYHKLLFKKLP